MLVSSDNLTEYETTSFHHPIHASKAIYAGLQRFRYEQKLYIVLSAGCCIRSAFSQRSTPVLYAVAAFEFDKDVTAAIVPFIASADLCKGLSILVFQLGQLESGFAWAHWLRRCNKGIPILFQKI